MTTWQKMKSSLRPTKDGKNCFVAIVDDLFSRGAVSEGARREVEPLNAPQDKAVVHGRNGHRALC